MATNKVTLPGSNRPPVGTLEGAPSPDSTVEVSVFLKPVTPLVLPHQGGAMLTREEFASAHGASAAAIDQVKSFASENNLTVTEVARARRTVKLKGTVADMSKAFGVTLHHYKHKGQTYRACPGPIKIPADMADSVIAVLGLDNRPQARAHFRVLKTRLPLATPAISYSPVQVAQLYNFPTDVDGTGQTVGIIELGGGYDTADLTKYFTSLGVTPPKVTTVLVDGGTNAPTNSSSDDGEVFLDIEVIGAVAPGARIVVYFTANTSQGFQDALTTAIHDTTNNPSVISISWGDSESNWTAQAMTAFDSAAQDGALLGVTICAASGDNGSSDGVTDGGNHVDFPASSPHILGCGGTSLQSSNGKITSETVWNDGASGGAGGGGYSAQFPLPSYQKSGSGRGVPDVSGDADPETGYNVLVDGDSLVIGGTSAVAPLWSGLIALYNAKIGKPLGFLQPTIYALPASSGAFHDITKGNNGAYSAGPGWDPASGLGSPSGENLLAALTPAMTKAMS